MGRALSTVKPKSTKRQLLTVADAEKRVALHSVAQKSSSCVKVEKSSSVQRRIGDRASPIPAKGAGRGITQTMNRSVSIESLGNDKRKSPSFLSTPHNNETLTAIRAMLARKDSTAKKKMPKGFVLLEPYQADEIKAGDAEALKHQIEFLQNLSQTKNGDVGGLLLLRYKTQFVLDRLDRLLEQAWLSEGKCPFCGRVIPVQTEDEECNLPSGPKKIYCTDSCVERARDRRRGKVGKESLRSTRVEKLLGQRDDLAIDKLTIDMSEMDVNRTVSLNLFKGRK